MKKLLCTLFFVVAGTALFGNEFSLSAGAGGLLGGSFTRYSISANGKIGSLDQKQEADQFNYGFFAFFDATYGIFSVSFQNGSSANNDGGMAYKSWESMLGFSLLGKYPFRLNDRLTIFPLLGAEYQLCLVKLKTEPDDSTVYRWNDYEAFELRDWNTFFINLGGGLDFSLPKNFFLRGELLYSIRLMTPYEQKFLDQIKKDTGDSSPQLSGLSSGPSLRISVGYTFYPAGIQRKKPQSAEEEPVRQEAVLDDRKEIAAAEEADVVEELEVIEAVEEVEEIQEADEVDVVEVIEAVEEIEEAPEAEEIEAVEEIEEIEEVPETEVIETVEEIEEVPEAEVIETVEEVEEIQEAEEVDVVEKLEVAEEADVVEELEVIEAVEEIEEVPEAEEIEAVEEIEEIEEVPETEVIEAVEEIEEVPEAEVIEAVEEIEEVPETEVIEKTPVLPAQYVVTTGDTLWDIAGKPEIYGNPWQWRRIYEANRGKMPQPNNPHLIHPGMILDIPSRAGEIRAGIRGKE